jgi:hypothetical protein
MSAWEDEGAGRHSAGQLEEGKDGSWLISASSGFSRSNGDDLPVKVMPPIKTPR